MAGLWHICFYSLSLPGRGHNPLSIKTLFGGWRDLDGKNRKRILKNIVEIYSFLITNILEYELVEMVRHLSQLKYPVRILRMEKIHDWESSTSELVQVHILNLARARYFQF